MKAWGKFDPSTGDSHLLIHHCLDVASVFGRIIQGTVVRSRLEIAAERILGDRDFQRLAVLAFLHDIGKLYPGFQAKGWDREFQTVPKTGHLQAGWAFLTLAHRWPEQHPFHATTGRILEWGEAVVPLLGAMFAHHGKPVDPASDPTLGEWPSLPHYDWKDEARQIGEALPQWFAEAFESGGDLLPDAPRFCHEVAGLASLADWIGSDRRFFPFEASFDPRYAARAQRAAERALREIRFDLDALACLPAPGFERLTGFAEPNPSQRTVGEVDPSSRLLVLEAETGSGKTEAAVWHFVRLLASGAVSGLYFAVPTRAAAKQLHRRVDDMLRRAFGHDSPETVLAIPGLIQAGSFRGQRLPGWEVLWDDEPVAAPGR